MSSTIFNDLYHEIKRMLSAKTLDTLLPLSAFLLMNRLFTLMVAGVSALVIAIIITVYRLIKKQSWQYAVAGTVSVMVALLSVYVSGQSKGYFLPSIINSVILLIISILTLAINRPFAMWLSHLSHGWSMDWYNREDIKPAYKEVTFIWLCLIGIRLLIQIKLYSGDGFGSIALFNSLLSTPATLLVLISSYVYGLWRLNQLNGPSVEEFEQRLPQPWHSQKKGF